MSTPPSHSPTAISAVHDLAGKTLATGWFVSRQVTPKPGSSGGYFSVSYIVEKDGEVAFMKALNTLTFLAENQNGMKATIAMLTTFEYERELLLRCESKNLSRVSKLIEADFEHVPGYLIPNVYYMIFEKAENDARNHINFVNDLDMAWKLRSLHHIATGIKQLHGIKISHQDLKPSNVFVYPGNVSKVGDLGRSLCEGLPSPFGNPNFAGDWGYAPPESLHNYALSTWEARAFAVDLFMLGSMAAFYITGQSMLAILSRSVPAQINITALNFEQALPYWHTAFDTAMEIISNSLGNFRDKEELVYVIRLLTNPDPRLRGHPRDHMLGKKYKLERIVEIFNLLARKAEIYLIKK